MSTPGHPPSEFEKGARVKITEDYHNHKAGETGEVVRSFETGNHYHYTYHIKFANGQDFAIPQNILTSA